MNVQSIIVFTVILGSGFCLHMRYKRVISGVTLNGRPTTYKSIRYYGAMLNAHSNIVLRKLFEALDVHGDLICSGSLIAPKIFQTACHCVAHYDVNVKTYGKPPLIDSHWEGRVVIYFGVSKEFGENSMETYSPVLSQRFIIHQKCEQLGNEEVISHDYAIIQLPYEWILSDDRTPYPWTEIEYAPQYTIKQMEDFHKYALLKKLVCLHVGFGTYDRTLTARSSDELRTGWAVIISRRQCLKRTSYISRVYLGDSSRVNWDCADNFTHHEQEVGYGDSGGPVSCGNKHFAVVSGITFSTDSEGNTYNVVNHYHPLIHNLFVNAVEYRDDLIHSIDDLKETYKHFVKDYYKSKITTTRKKRKLRPRSGFVLKLRDTKPPLLTSQGLNYFANSFSLNVAIWIHIL